MIRPAIAASAILLLTAGCEPGSPLASDGPIADPSPAAPLGESILEPTDGFDNEITADG